MNANGRLAGLPPIRTSQPALGMSAPQMDAYSLPRTAHQLSQPQLPPLSIPGSSSQQNVHGYSGNGHIDYNMDSAVRTGMPHGATRPHAVPSASDDSYFDYMLNEVGVANDLFPRGDGTSVGFINVNDYGYGAPPTHNYREQHPQMQTTAYGGHAHHRPTSFHLPSMHYYGHDGAR